MDERFKTFWLGLFMVVALAMIAGLLLFLRPSYGDSRKILHIRFPNVEKISVGTKVTFAGKPVGNVVAINEIHNAREEPTSRRGEYYFYELVLKVDSSVKIYDCDQIVFSTTGLLGEKSIAIIPKPPCSGENAHEITNNTLYASGGESFEESLTQLSHLSETFTVTLTNINQLIDETKEPFKKMLGTVTDAAHELTLTLQDAREKELIQGMKEATNKISLVFTEILDSDLVYHLSTFSKQLNSTSGTMGRLLSNDDLYCELLSVISQLRMLVHDINDYGLLFQYNKRWQRRQMMRCCP